MEPDLASTLIDARQAAIRQAALMAIMRKNHEMQRHLLEMVADVGRPAPPPGQGALVDKTA